MKKNKEERMRGQSLEELPWLLSQPRIQSRHILAFFKDYQRHKLKSHYSIKKDQARQKVYLVFFGGTFDVKKY